MTTFWLVLMLGCSMVASGRTGEGNQRCGDQKFYCSTTDQCFDRSLRCTGSKVCVDSSGNEVKCFESSTPGKYKYFKKTAPLPSSGSSSKRKRSVSLWPSHWFVEYRGFVYEFGSSYGTHELDVNDPNYKYGPGGEKILSEDLVGSSSCTRDQVNSFVKRWRDANPNYNLFLNNCQHFVKLLLEELGMNCPNRRRREVDDTESLKAPSECLSSSAIRWKFHSVFVPLISLAVLLNINWTWSTSVDAISLAFTLTADSRIFLEGS